MMFDSTIPPGEEGFLLDADSTVNAAKHLDMADSKSTPPSCRILPDQRLDRFNMLTSVIHNPRTTRAAEFPRLPILRKDIGLAVARRKLGNGTAKNLPPPKQLAGLLRLKWDGFLCWAGSMNEGIVSKNGNPVLEALYGNGVPW